MKKELSIYENKSLVKWLLTAAALLLSCMFLLYTSWLVRQLSEREKREIALFAKIQASVAASLQEDCNFTLLTEILDANDQIPVILVDEDSEPVSYRNLKLPENLSTEEERAYLIGLAQTMSDEYEPIRIKLGENWYNYIHYTNSDVVRQLRYAPFWQFIILSVFILFGYYIFSLSRAAEQNNVWEGLAKETAHQLSTPISSLSGWIEYMRDEDSTNSEMQYISTEIEKDTYRLKLITERFSNIGFAPTLSQTDIVEVIKSNIRYLSRRVGKVDIVFMPQEEFFYLPLNESLFGWVIENLIKNAADAMGGKADARVIISMLHQRNALLIDVSDNGRGIPKNKVKKVFNPGFTTKKLGWGLGLTLVKRIVENYHKGKIFVKKSGAEGTTFRIILPTTS